MADFKTPPKREQQHERRHRHGPPQVRLAAQAQPERPEAVAQALLRPHRLHPRLLLGLELDQALRHHLPQRHPLAPVPQEGRLRGQQPQALVQGRAALSRQFKVIPSPSL